jgi:hypothetical protein
MKTKKLSKKIRSTSKTLIITVIFLLFSSLPSNAQDDPCSKVGVESNWVVDDNVYDENGDPNPNRGAIIIDYEKIKMTGTSWVRINFRLGPWCFPNDETPHGPNSKTWFQTYDEVIDGLLESEETNIKIYGLIGSEAVKQNIGTEPEPNCQYNWPSNGTDEEKHQQPMEYISTAS